MSAARKKVTAYDNTYETQTDTTGLRDLTLLGKLWPFIKPHQRGLWISMALLPLVTITQMVQPYLIRFAIDGPIMHADLPLLWQYSFGFLGILVVHYLVRHWQMKLSQQVGQYIVRDIRLALYRHLQNLSMAFFHRNPVGKLVTRVTSDVENLSEMLSSGGLAILQDLALIAGGIIGMFWMQWQLALVGLAMLFVNIFVMEFFRLKARKAYNDIRVKLARLNIFLQENIQGIEITQSYRREANNLARFDELSHSYYVSRMESIIYTLSFNSIVELITIITNVIILWIAGEAILQGEMTYGLLVAFFLLIGLVFEPIENVSEKMTILQSGLASIDKLMALFQETPEIQDKPDAKPLAHIEGKVEFRDVKFSYKKEGPEILRGINLAIEPGETIAIVGPTGSGKTTLIKLLMRFYDVTSGDILVDGLPIKDSRLADLRRQIISIQQDDMLFSRTVAENITLTPGGMSALSADEQERLLHAARTINALQLIERLPGGFDAPLTEQGKNLSQGERQLLLFARAVYHDPKILILDEATSAVDAETERLVQDALEILLKGRTALVIAHRLKTIEEADRIIVLADGLIAESGTHDTLLKSGGLYATLHQYQHVLSV